MTTPRSHNHRGRRRAVGQEPRDPRWCMSEVDIFADLTEADMERLARSAPMRRVPAGDLVYSPGRHEETLFILKEGRVRIFRLSAEGRALTTAILTPGTVFGEMQLLGQQMHDNYAEALDDVVVCVMDRADVERLLLSDSRVAVRISAILGARVSELERRLSDTVFKPVPARVAATLCLLADQATPRPFTGELVVRLTHEQVAALAGTARETTTTVLGELAASGLVRLGRGRITVLDTDRLHEMAERE